MDFREPTAISERLAQIEQARTAPRPEVPASPGTHGQVQEGGAVGGGGVPERERPDLGPEQRPRVERQPTGAATAGGATGGVPEAGGDRTRRAEARGAQPESDINTFIAVQPQGEDEVDP